MFSFLTDITGSDIVDNILSHSWPEVKFGCLLVGAFLSLVSSKGVVMYLFEGFGFLMPGDNFSRVLMLSSSMGALLISFSK